MSTLSKVQPTEADLFNQTQLRLCKKRQLQLIICMSNHWTVVADSMVYFQN